MTHAPHRNHGCRLRDFTWRGRRCVSVENEVVRALFCVDKGCDILEFTHKPTDTEFLHQSPRGLGSPADQAASALPGGPFRDAFPGGWYLMLPNGPGPCAHRGAEWGHHGEATLLAWEAAVDRDEPDEVAVRFWTRLRRVPLLVERRVRLAAGSGALLIEERVANEGGHAVEFLWGHHPTFGGPFLAPGGRVHLPPCRASVADSVPADARLAPGQSGDWPLLKSRDGGDLDLSVIPDAEVRAHDFVRVQGADWFAVTTPAGVGVAVRWDAALFPVLGVWQLWNGGPDYPWYNRHRLLALEPACDLPSLAEAAARGAAVTLAPGEARSTPVEATAFQGAPERIRSIGPGGVIA